MAHVSMSLVSYEICPPKSDHFRNGDSGCKAEPTGFHLAWLTVNARAVHQAQSTPGTSSAPRPTVPKPSYERPSTNAERKLTKQYETSSSFPAQELSRESSARFPFELDLNIARIVYRNWGSISRRRTDERFPARG